ncbi:hypothetical protein [Pseudoalteromonas maricaloris]|uniref:Uncharacterized protein n=1 Tax=Pseudoalteromonas maricaloris TaxID=184924 RepID=A0A8I2H5J4_9GAMM|nr:hypothetical protein [Pseudoalteromonas maricaloris]NLR21459.1 hypothetical protein [Pseudoalteromonas maricaloris]WOX30546.1 hypothetical protein R5H13_07925 [Pseudoalteromonas maricaloris]
MDALGSLLDSLDGMLGGSPWFPYVLLGVGLFFTIYLKFPQILVLGGFLYIYWQQPDPNSFEMIASKSVIGIGAVWYLINRVILVILKKKK